LVVGRKPRSVTGRSREISSSLVSVVVGHRCRRPTYRANTRTLPRTTTTQTLRYYILILWYNDIIIFTTQFSRTDLTGSDDGDRTSTTNTRYIDRGPDIILWRFVVDKILKRSIGKNQIIYIINQNLYAWSTQPRETRMCVKVNNFCIIFFFFFFVTFIFLIFIIFFLVYAYSAYSYMYLCISFQFYF